MIERSSSESYGIKFIQQHKDLVADALLQEAANLSGFGGKYRGEKLKQLERTVRLLRELAEAIRGLEERHVAEK